MLKENPDDFGYLSELPSNIRPLFQFLCKEVAFLTELCAFYFGLFGDKKNLSVISSTSPRSFKIIENTLRTSMVFSISRLADNLLFRKDMNLCMSTLVISVGDDDDILLCKLKTFRDSCKPIKKWRHKVYAHNDLKYLSDKCRVPLPHINKRALMSVIDAAKDLLNHVSKKFGKSEFAFEPAMFRAADSLIFWLKSGIKREEEFKNSSVIP